MQAIKIMEDLASQKATETLSSNKHILGLHEQIGELAKTAAHTLQGYVASKDRDPEMALSTRLIMELISALTVGEVMTRTTAEAMLHPSPTARINALMTNKAARKLWAEIIISNHGKNKKGPDTQTNLRKAAMCLLLKIEGTGKPKWRGAVQLMNWVANKIPIMATPIMRDIFPSLDIKRIDRKAYSILMNTASTRQWGAEGVEGVWAAEQQMPKQLRYSQEEWEAGKYCDRKLEMFTDHPLAPKICQANTLFLLCAVAELYGEDTITLERRDTEPGARCAAKEGLRHAAMQGASLYLETSEVEYDETTLETAIAKAYEMGKERLGTMLKAAHEATKRGTGKTMTETFGGKGAKCPDCEKSNVDKDIILEQTRPAKGIHEHLYICGNQKGNNNKRKGSPHRENNKPRRGNFEQSRVNRQMPGTPPRGMPHRGMGTRGSNLGRGGYFGNSPRHHQENQGMFQNTGYDQQGQGLDNMNKGALGNNGRGFGYQTQEYRDQQTSTQNQQPGQGMWNYKDNHNR